MDLNLFKHDNSFLLNKELREKGNNFIVLNNSFHLAIKWKAINCLNLLLSNYSNYINYPDIQGRTPLLYAIQKQFMEGIRLILIHPLVDVSKTDNELNNLYHYIIHNLNYKDFLEIEFLLTKKIDFIYKNNIYLKQPVFLAIKNNNEYYFNYTYNKYLLDGYDFKNMYEDIAQYCNNKIIIKNFIITNRNNILKQINNNNELFDISYHYKNILLCKYLIIMGININSIYKTYTNKHIFEFYYKFNKRTINNRLVNNNNDEKKGKKRL